MEIIENSLKNRRSDRKVMKSDEEMLTPVLSIVEEETSLSTEQEEHEVTIPIPTSLLDTHIDTNDGEDVQYEFRNDGVTYRVMQMTSECVETTSPSISQPSSTTSTGTNSSVHAIYNYPINGGIYVIGSAQKVIDPLSSGTQKTVISRVNVENSRPQNACRRDDRRRATHNEVERRRRDKINNWIHKLSKIIPECKQESPKGNFEAQSKGGILAKACDYIMELRESNQRLLVYAKENEQLIAEVDSLSRKVDDLRQENERLRQGIKQTLPLET